MFFKLTCPEFLTFLLSEGGYKPSSKTMTPIEGDIVYSQVIARSAADAVKKLNGWSTNGMLAVTLLTTHGLAGVPAQIRAWRDRRAASSATSLSLDQPLHGLAKERS